jgi:hypothetical protein
VVGGLQGSTGARAQASSPLHPPHPRLLPLPLPSSSSSFLPAVKITGIDMKTVRGRDLIIVEDIIDTGTTMSKLIPALEEYGPKSVRVAALLEKRTPKSCGFKADYVGFSVPDAFVVGAFSFCCGCRVWGAPLSSSPCQGRGAPVRRSPPPHSPRLPHLPRVLDPPLPPPHHVQATTSTTTRPSGSCRTFASSAGRGSRTSRATPSSRASSESTRSGGGKGEEGREGEGRGGASTGVGTCTGTGGPLTLLLACATAQFRHSFSPAAPAQRAALPPPQSRGSRTRLLHLGAHIVRRCAVHRCADNGRRNPGA